jgi:hypothetical protein
LSAAGDREVALTLSEPFWDATSDLRSTGNMFRSPNVGAIALDIQYDPQEDVPISTPECQECREVTTSITLQVVTSRQDNDPLILAVRSQQVFLVSKDPANTALWVVRQQIDQEGSGKRGSTRDDRAGARSATEEKSWGAVKALFR